MLFAHQTPCYSHCIHNAFIVCRLTIVFAYILIYLYQIVIALTCKGYGLIWAMIFIYIALHYHISTVILYVIILTSRPPPPVHSKKILSLFFCSLEVLSYIFFLSMVQLQQKTERENCIESLIQILNHSRCLCWGYGVGCERIQWHISWFYYNCCYDYCCPCCYL